LAERIQYLPDLEAGEPNGVVLDPGTAERGVPANRVFDEEEMEARLLSLQQYYMTIRPDLFEGKEDWVDPPRGKK